MTSETAIDEVSFSIKPVQLKHAKLLHELDIHVNHNSEFPYVQNNFFYQSFVMAHEFMPVPMDQPPKRRIKSAEISKSSGLAPYHPVRVALLPDKEDNDWDVVDLAAEEKNRNPTEYNGQALGYIAVVPYTSKLAQNEHICGIVWQVVSMSTIGEEAYQKILKSMIDSIISVIRENLDYSDIVIRIPFSTAIPEHTLTKEVLLQCGFEFNGVTKQIYNKNGRFCDQLTMQLLIPENLGKQRQWHYPIYDVPSLNDGDGRTACWQAGHCPVIGCNCDEVKVKALGQSYVTMAKIMDFTMSVSGWSKWWED